MSEQEKKRQQSMICLTLKPSQRKQSKENFFFAENELFF